MRVTDLPPGTEHEPVLLGEDDTMRDVLARADAAGITPAGPADHLAEARLGR